MFLIVKHLYLHYAQSGNVLTVSTDERPDDTKFQATWRDPPTLKDSDETEFVLDLIRKETGARTGNPEGQLYLL